MTPSSIQVSFFNIDQEIVHNEFYCDFVQFVAAEVGKISLNITSRLCIPFMFPVHTLHLMLISSGELHNEQLHNYTIYQMLLDLSNEFLVGKPERKRPFGRHRA
jgi:hypothetical protein